jgi:Domain of unknown function (DUF4350)
MPARRGSSDLTILAAAAALMAVLSVVSFLISPVDSSPRVAGSSYSARPEGTKAAYLLLKELGHTLERSFEPLAELRADPTSTILVLANPEAEPSNQDQRALRSFVEAGGIVLAFGRSAARFLPGVVLRGAPPANGDVLTFTAARPSPLNRGALEFSARRGLAPKLDAIYVPVYGSGDEAAVVAGRFGEGQIVWSFDHSPIQNDGIGRANNVRLLANAAGAPGARTIHWDEHYHGERRSLWSYVAATPLPWGLAQLMVVAVAGLAAVSRRRGPVQPRPAEPRTSPLEFIDTMASLYERAGVWRAAVEAARGRLRRRLAVSAGLSIAATDDELVAAAALRAGIDRDRTAAALSAAAEALRTNTIRERDLIAVVAELQAVTAGQLPTSQRPTSKSVNGQPPRTNFRPPR